MMQLINKMILVVLLVGFYGMSMALRDPFMCGHTHTASLVMHQNNSSPVSQSNSAIPQSDASEWRIINEKEGSVVMQHKDGSIREITMSQK